MNTKSTLVGLLAGTVLLAAGVILMNPDNREKIMKSGKKFKKQIDNSLEQLKEQMEQAKEKGEDKLVDELSAAEQALRKARKKLEAA